MDDSNDHGRHPESARMYESDMAVYIGEDGGKNARQRQILQQNIQLMKTWLREGK